MRKTSDVLQCKVMLTDEEIIKYSRESSAASSKKSRLENELKTFSSQKKAEITEQDSKVLRISETINNGYEYRGIKCNIVYDFDKKIKSWVRVDTGEIEKEDIIEDWELQEEAGL